METHANPKCCPDTITVSEQGSFLAPYPLLYHFNDPFRLGLILGVEFSVAIVYVTSFSFAFLHCINVEVFSSDMCSLIRSFRQTTKSSRNNMQHSWTRDTDWTGGNSSARRGRSNSNAAGMRSPQTPHMAAHLSSIEIEEQILQSPELQHHHAAVVLYLQLDIWLLESIFALRNSESAQLAQLHPSLFDSPPEPLFHLIYTLRHFPGLDLTSTIERIESLQATERGKERSREPGSSSRVAPRGQAYGCPSKHCKKAFVKSGHAANHVEKQHPEYLKLHPDYQPSHFMVEHHRSCPTSPELERQERRRSSNRPHELRPSKALSRTQSATATHENLAVYWNDGSGAAWERPSPQLHGYDSQGDSDEAPQLFPTGQLNRTVSYPSPSYSGTAQEASEQGMTYTSRYYAPVNQWKRSREHSSSSGSNGTVRDMEDGNTTRFRRHQAKRRSAYGTS